MPQADHRVCRSGLFPGGPLEPATVGPSQEPCFSGWLLRTR